MGQSSSGNWNTARKEEDGAKMREKERVVRKTLTRFRQAFEIRGRDSAAKIYKLCLKPEERKQRWER